MNQPFQGVVNSKTMREIKFRAWFNGQMYDDAYINKYTLRHWIDSIKCPVMQFTGMKDKNRREIYEGDILKITDPYDEGSTVTDVYFTGGGFIIQWDGAFNGGDADLTTIGWAMDSDFTFEVIGNIHENPDLLRG